MVLLWLQMTNELRPQGDDDDATESGQGLGRLRVGDRNGAIRSR